MNVMQQALLAAGHVTQDDVDRLHRQDTIAKEQKRKRKEARKKREAVADKPSNEIEVQVRIPAETVQKVLSDYRTKQGKEAVA